MSLLSDAARHSSFREGLEPVFSQPERADLQTRKAPPQTAESPRSGWRFGGLKKGLSRKGKIFFASLIR